MTQPVEAPLYDTPAAAAARTSAIQTYTQYEAALYAAYLEMITGWLDQVKAAMVTSGVKALALLPDPYTVFAQTPTWHTLVDTYTETVVRDVLDAAYQHVLPGVQEYASRPFVHNFITTSANKMKHVPDEVFALVRQIVTDATANGASIPDITAQIEALLSATGTDTWKNRAKTVARTEVHAAYEGGMYDAFRMLVEADTETAYVARWLVTEDERTRPTHRQADGQTVPFGTHFTIGGFPMLYPGDPEGPASEVINCRCTLLLEEEGEPTNMENRGYKPNSLAAAAAAANPRSPKRRVMPVGTFGFNPLEKRDGHGRWTIGGKIKEALKGGKDSEVRPGGHTVLSGYGKKFDGKTVHQIAQEHAAGKHTLADLPHSVREYIKPSAPQKLGDFVPDHSQEAPSARRLAAVAEDKRLLAAEDKRLADLEEHGASGPGGKRLLEEARRHMNETRDERLRRLRREAAAADMD